VTTLVNGDDQKGAPITSHARSHPTRRSVYAPGGARAGRRARRAAHAPGGARAGRRTRRAAHAPGGAQRFTAASNASAKALPRPSLSPPCAPPAWPYRMLSSAA
jgi:hypothetical protein